MIEDYFPTGIAKGQAFLGRKKEKLKLTNNIERGRHTLVLAARRFGKTSLIKQTLREMNILSEEIDLFLATDALSIQQNILNSTKRLINKISDTPEQWFKDLMNYFRKANKKWTVGMKGFGIEIDPDNHEDIPGNILESLNALELVLRKKKQSAVLFIDEIQEIANVSNSKAIEGAVRHFAQESKYLTFIFSGSNQHMLEHMFNDRSRPLYELCDRIHLNKIGSEKYRAYLKKIAKKTWGNELSEDVFNQIIMFTECHPKRIYALCGHLWDRQIQAKRPPSPDDVTFTWNEYVRSKLKDTRNELSNRSSGQIKILTLIAVGRRNELTGQEIQRKINMSGSAIVQALHVLEQKDYIQRLDGGSYQIIDPLIKSTFLLTSIPLQDS